MKILHLISQTPDFTGSGKFIQQIIHHARQKGHTNYLVAGTQSDFILPEDLICLDRAIQVRFDGKDLPFPVAGMSDVMPYDSTVFSSMSDGDIETYIQVFKAAIVRAIRQFEPDLIHAHHLWIVSSIAREAAQELPMVVTCHGTCLRQHRFCPRISDRISRTLKGIDRVMALNFSQQDDIIERFGFDTSRVPVMAGGFDDTLFTPGIKPGGNLVEICYAGKLSRAKGLPWLLKSLARISDLPFRLNLAGGGSGAEKEMCLSMAADLGDKAVYHGTLSHQELAELMRRSHLFVLPSFFEGVPLVLMEALACGCRILATDLPGTKEILSPPDNDLVTFINLPPLESIDAPFQADEPILEQRLSEALSILIRNIMDRPAPEFPAIDERTRPHTWTKVFDRIESVYEDAAAGRRA
ncbi:MAG: glycosyltransferase family 4 protein [Desulfobacterales bacterium]|nr:glycosyltransferase family 4 protein [Desulfobacterales bacterium]